MTIITLTEPCGAVALRRIKILTITIIGSQPITVSTDTILRIIGQEKIVVRLYLRVWVSVAKWVCIH